MELDNIKLETTWNDAAWSLNNNFAKISQAINTGEGGGGGGSSYDDTELRELIEAKQDELVSGENIKTINSQSVLGGGNIEVGSVASVETGDAIDDVDIDYATEEYVDSALDGKQDTLISGENIKTINGQSVLGSGNITIEGGGPSYDDTELRNTVNLVTERVDDLESEMGDKVSESDVATINGQSILNGGNVIAGDVSSVATGDEVDDVNIRYATEAYVDEAIANIEISGGGESYDDTELRDKITSLTNEMLTNEEVTASALNSQNERITALEENVSGVSATKIELEEAVTNINTTFNAIILENEEVTASAINDLNTRLNEILTRLNNAGI